MFPATWQIGHRTKEVTSLGCLVRPWSDGSAEVFDNPHRGLDVVLLRRGGVVLARHPALEAAELLVVGRGRPASSPPQELAEASGPSCGPRGRSWWSPFLIAGVAASSICVVSITELDSKNLLWKNFHFLPLCSRKARHTARLLISAKWFCRVQLAHCALNVNLGLEQPNLFRLLFLLFLT